MPPDVKWMHRKPKARRQPVAQGLDRLGPAAVSGSAYLRVRQLRHQEQGGRIWRDSDTHNLTVGHSFISLLFMYVHVLLPEQHT